MELKQQQYLLTKKRSIHQMMDHKPLMPSFGTNEVIIIDDDDEEKEDLEMNKNKKQRVLSWWEEHGAFNELSSVVKGLPKPKDATTNLHERKANYESALALIQNGNFFALFDDKSPNNANSKTIQDPLLGRHKNNDNMSHVDSCFNFISLNDLVKDTKKGNEISSSSSHHHANNFIDLNEDEILGESSIASNKVNRHVTLEELGVTLEDLKSMPWEAFDPTWEIKSETMDPWLGGYVKDMLSSAD